jgi:hypothetical protein
VKDRREDEWWTLACPFHLPALIRTGVCALVNPKTLEALIRELEQ